MPELKAAKVAPEGLGFGEGAISYRAREAEVGADTLERIEQLVQSPQILVQVSRGKHGGAIDDDGCGDGRGVSRIFEGQAERLKSLHRSKVFGGGATMAVAMSIGLGHASGRSLNELFSAGIRSLRDKTIDFGAHTDTHAHGPNCGCGAIDKAPRNIRNVVNYRDQVRAVIESLGVGTSGLDELFDAYGAYSEEMQSDGYVPSNVMREIVDSGKVVKELEGDHKEMIVVLNLAESLTVDQEQVRKLSDGKAQAFAVDVWRARQLAERLYADLPAETRHQAFLSELAYTLGTAATLTKGDLPVYSIST